MVLLSLNIFTPAIKNIITLSPIRKKINTMFIKHVLSLGNIPISKNLRTVAHWKPSSDSIHTNIEILAS